MWRISRGLARAHLRDATHRKPCIGAVCRDLSGADRRRSNRVETGGRNRGGSPPTASLQKQVNKTADVFTKPLAVGSLDVLRDD